MFCPHLCPVVHSYAVRASPLLAVLFLWIRFYFYLPCLCVNHTRALHNYPWQNESLWNTWPIFFPGKTVMHLFTQMPCLKRECKYWKEIKKERNGMQNTLESIKWHYIYSMCPCYYSIRRPQNKRLWPEVPQGRAATWLKTLSSHSATSNYWTEVQRRARYTVLQLNWS